MKKIHGITLKKDTAIAGEFFEKGDELFVPEDVSQENAEKLLKMVNRATEIKADGEEDETPEADGGNVPDKQPAINSVQLLSLLDKKASEIEKAVRERKDDKPVVSDEDLARLYKAEEDGNTRKNVVHVLEAEMKARDLKKEGLFSKFFGNKS